jgi:hypothetical protein
MAVMSAMVRGGATKVALCALACLGATARTSRAATRQFLQLIAVFWLTLTLPGRSEAIAHYTPG